MNDTPATPAETTATEVQPTDAGTAAPVARQQGTGFLIPMMLLLAIFYFMMIRPQQRKEKERRKMIEELRVGAKVVFSGGIIGTIVEATEKTFRVSTAAGTEMEILRGCVQDVVVENK
jgi:preprotein translocase subunit YajC